MRAASLPSSFDVDRAAGMAQRERIFRMAAEEDFLVARSHLSFLGIGRVPVGARGYHFIPVVFAIP